MNIAQIVFILKAELLVCLFYGKIEWIQIVGLKLQLKSLGKIIDDFTIFLQISNVSVI